MNDYPKWEDIKAKARAADSRTADERAAGKQAARERREVYVAGRQLTELPDEGLT